MPAGNEIANAILLVEITSQSGSYNGAVLAEITSADGSVEVVTLTNSYDANVGKTFDLYLESTDSVRLGITIPGNTIWSDSAGSILTADVTENSAVINIEDDGGNDFDDVVLTASLLGGGSVTLPEDVTIAGTPYPVAANLDFDDMADQVTGTWEYLDTPDGWFMTMQVAKLRLVLKTNISVAVMLKML